MEPDERRWECCWVADDERQVRFEARRMRVRHYPKDTMVGWQVGLRLRVPLTCLLSSIGDEVGDADDLEAVVAAKTSRSGSRAIAPSCA